MLEITRDLIEVLSISFNTVRNLEFQSVPTLPQISMYTVTVILFLLIL